MTTAENGYQKHLHKPRRPGEYAGLFARGLCMGSADVVPGVSGGTMAFILGIYEELIDSIRAVGRSEFLRPLSRLRLREAFAVLNWKFLLALGAGVLSAILTLAKGIEWLLENRPVMVWSFFFGLVLASVITVSRRIAYWSPKLLLLAAVGAAGAWLFVGLVPLQTPNDWWFIFLSGAVAICAMILPGISGAFVLLLLGKYHYILSSLNDRQFEPLVWLALGALIGIVTFAQVLGWLFRHYHDATVAVLTGLMVGSLRKVWPWKVDVEWIVGSHGEKIPTVQHNVLPAAGDGVLTAVLLALFGLAVVLLLEWWANRVGEPELEPGS